MAADQSAIPLDRFLPSDVLDAVEAIPANKRQTACQAGIGLLQSVAALKPVDRISGFSSQMDDTADVGKTVDDFVSGAVSAMTGAYVEDDPVQKEFVLRLLAKWAKAGAFTKTTDCSGMGKACQEWTSKRGTEAAPVKDYQTVQEAIVPLAMGYYTTLRDFEPEKFADEHAAIAKWLGIFFKRMPRNAIPASEPIGFGFGLKWQTWGQPLIDLVNGKPKSFDARVANVARRLGGLVNDDGSLDRRTVRGSSAVWYHFAGLNELFYGLEMLKANGTDLYPDLTPRIEKAVGIYLDAVDDLRTGQNTPDHLARIYKWAKADFHSADDPRVQHYEPNVLMDGYGDWGSWMFVYLYRFPQGENADRLRSLVAGLPKLPELDRSTGLNTGCLYRLADLEQRERELSQGSLVPAEKRVSLIEAIDAPERSFAQPLTYGFLSLTRTNKDAQGAQYIATLGGVSVAGQPAQTLYFTVLVDYTGTGKGAGAKLFRLGISDGSLHDPASSPAAMNSCPVLARQHSSQLNYGAEASANPCILLNMGPADRTVWESVYAAFPGILKAEAGNDKTAAELYALSLTKVAKK